MENITVIWSFRNPSNILINIIIYIYIHTHSLATLLGTLLVPVWTPFCLQNFLNSSWHRINKVLETFLRDFGPYWHDSITQLLQICRLHIHDANLPPPHPKGALLDWDLVTVEAIWVKWTHSINQSEMIWAFIHNASCWKSHQKMGTL